MVSATGAVPKLDISIDQDHMKWLQEQSARKESKSYKPLEEELAMIDQHKTVPRSGKPATRSGGYTKHKIQKE